MFKETNCLKFLIPSSEFVKNQYLNGQCTSEVARLLSSERKFDWTVITELDLSSLNILHVAGLGMVTSLRSLRLANNQIRKIENLHRLVNLESLDLSLNRLTDVENLDRLAALKHLNVAGNRISELRNLDGNARLETFVANDNDIADVGQVFYMRRFEFLWSMNVANNAFDDDDPFRQLIAEHFPRLRYLNNRRVTELDRPPGAHNAASAKTPDETARSAFLTDTDGKRFVDHLLDGDGDGILLSKWNATVAEAFETYKKKIADAAVAMCHASLKKLADREKRRLTFEMALYAFQRQWTSKSRDVITEFEEIRDIRLKSFDYVDGEGYDDDNYVDDDSEDRITMDVEVLSIRRYFDSPESLISAFEDELAGMTNRLLATNNYMNRSILEMIRKYEKNIDDELKSLFETLAVTFDGMPEIANTYSQVMTQVVKFDVDNPHKAIRKVYIDRFENRLAILQATYKSIGKHLDKINKREEMMNIDARKWAKNTIDELKQSEEERFKMVMEEIRDYRECSLISIRKLIEYPSLETE